MDRHLAELFIRPVVAVVVVGVATTLGLAVARLRRPRGVTEVRAPAYYVGVGLMALLLAGGFLWMGLAGEVWTRGPGQSGPWLGLVAAFAVGGLAAAVAGAVFHLTWSDEGLDVRNHFCRRRRVAWARS